MQRVARADADTVRAATGYPIGGVAPLAHPAPLRTLIDTHLAGFEVVWAAAGTPHAVFPTSYDELLRLTGATPGGRRRVMTETVTLHVWRVRPRDVPAALIASRITARRLRRHRDVTVAKVLGTATDAFFRSR